MNTLTCTVFYLGPFYIFLIIDDNTGKIRTHQIRIRHEKFPHQFRDFLSSMRDIPEEYNNIDLIYTFGFDYHSQEFQDWRKELEKTRCKHICEHDQAGHFLKERLKNYQDVLKAICAHILPDKNIELLSGAPLEQAVFLVYLAISLRNCVDKKGRLQITLPLKDTTELLPIISSNVDSPDRIKLQIISLLKERDFSSEEDQLLDLYSMEIRCKYICDDFYRKNVDFWAKPPTFITANIHNTLVFIV